MADALTPEQYKFIQLCVKGLSDLNLAGSADHKERLKLELKEINVQAEHEYFLTLVNKKLRFSRNENNLLVAVLLGICDTVDMNSPPAYIQGEFPDIDMDYLPEIQKWIKNDWAPKKFGRENVCSITAYGKLGIKSSILDMTKIYGISKDEIQGITTSMEDKDDEGEILKWDKALSMYPAFKAYCEKNPEIASLAQTLISRRKSASMHAGGLIISSVPISDFVPLEVRSVDKDNKYGVIVSAWSEGQATQDLGPVGLVKFDVLVVDGLMQIALTCDLLRKRRGIESVCALPNRRNWSDTSYLDDPASIAMANRADLKCCFQFGSEGIRKLVKKGGVTCFDDIATYSAIFRPGPLGMGMGERFCLRKRGLEEYELHPLLQPILGPTYGVMAYQEQVMKILNIVGNIPLIHCEKIRKAISKKKVELFAKYKEMFLINGQKNLGESLEYVQNLWETIESFADYGFNKSMTIGTKIASVDSIKQIQDFVPGDVVYCVNERGETVETEVIALHDHGEIEGFEVTFDDGHKVTCSINHKFLTEKGQVSLENICRLHLTILCDQQDRSVYAQEETGRMEDGLRSLLRASIVKRQSVSSSYSSSQGQNVERRMYKERKCDASSIEHGMFCKFDGGNEERDLGLGSGHAEISDTRNLVHRKIVRVVPVGKCHMFDLEVANPTHNFLLANGVVTSNSHSYAYSYITARQLMLKSHWPLEFYTAVLMCADEVDKLKTIKMDAMNHGIEVLPVHINKSKANFSIVDHDDTGKIYYGFSNLKTVGAEVAAKIESLQPFTSFADFLDRFGTDAKVVKCLIALSVFDEPYERLTLYKFYEYYKDKFVKRRECGKRHEEATEKRLEKLKALINSTDVSAELKEKLAVYDSEEVYDQWTALFSTVERTEEYKSKGTIKTRQKSVAEMLHALRKDHESKVKLFESKEKIAEEAPPSIDSFNPHKFTFKEKELEKLAPYLEVITQPDTKMAEKMYYGFQWIHDLEEAPEYAGFTIDKFLGEAELQGNIVGCIEVQVIKCERKDFKSGNGFAYDAVVEDANGKEIVVRFWKDDYDRFQDDLVPGTLMKMRVKPPVGSFPSFNFESPPRHERWKLPKNRADDCRVVVMEKAAPKAKTNVVDLTDEFTLEIL